MAELYGKPGQDVIHVHHLRELARLRHDYEVDPISDLRPVCPNCHAILHTSRPAMTIEKLQKVLAGRTPIRWPGNK
jgi:5-methylcytosine-specific restriction protein A